MKLLLASSVAITVCTMPVASEVIQTTDGRSVDLKDDGTYEFLEGSKSTSVGLVEFEEPYFESHSGEYGRKFIRFMPIFRNVGERKIIAIKFTAKFLNSFGEEVFSFSGDSEERVAPGRQSTNNLFYNFEDNEFIGGQPYDKLMPMVTNKSSNIKVSLDKIAFEDGEVLQLSD